MGSLCSCLCPDNANTENDKAEGQMSMRQPLIRNQDPKISLETFNIETLIG